METAQLPRNLYHIGSPSVFSRFSSGTKLLAQLVLLALPVLLVLLVPLVLLALLAPLVLLVPPVLPPPVLRENIHNNIWLLVLVLDYWY